MGTLSMLSGECKKCPNVKECNNKRRVACAFIEMPKKLSSGCNTSLTSKIVAPMARTRTPITIKMGEYCNINTSLEEINERIAEDFNKKIFNLNCAFNKS